MAQGMLVSKQFTFHAAHLDAEAPEGDQCARLHGHTYLVELSVKTHRGDRGMVLHGDYFKQFYRERIEPKVEHQFLNETLDFNPTMEGVCEWIASEFAAWLLGLLNPLSFVVSVTLWETPTMSATVERMG